MCDFYVRNGVLGANFFIECATISAGSDDERPRPARAAPAESPARLALKPKAKKPRAQDDPNFIDLKTLKKGTRFTIIASLDETAYGVSSVSVRMKIDEETGLAVCLEPACGQRCWSNKPESTSFYFALRHAHAFHLPGKFTIISRPLPPAAAAEGGGTTRTAQVTLAPKPLHSSFQPSPPPLKSGPLYADVRANAEAAAARAPPRPSVPAPPPPPAADEEDAMPPGSSSSTSTQTQFLDCPGVVLAVPSPGCENYPFQLHSHLSSSTSTRWQSTLRWSTRVMSPRRSFQK